MFLSILISIISVKNQDNLVASEKGRASTAQPGRDGNAPETLLAALLIFFRDVPAGAAFRERFAKNLGAAQITMRAQAHLEQDGTCTIDTKSGDRLGFIALLQGAHGKMLLSTPLRHTMYDPLETSTSHDRPNPT